MTARRFFTCLLALPFALLCAGCAAFRPDHITVYAERSETETAGERRSRAVGVKEGVSATFDLH